MGTILPYGGIHPRIHPTAFIAPGAVVIGNVTIEEEASVWFGAVIRGDEPEFEIRVGARTSIQDNVVLHVSRQGATIIGPDVTVGHGAILESCVVGRGALIGMNAVVLQRATVGEQALIAAGAVVGSSSEVPPRTLAAGTPARVKKELEGESLRWVSTSAAHYVELSRTYLAQGIGRVDGQTGVEGDG
ncbi:MAG TPA: gamma carbonic anhydrase family protein [Longimicrobium sp.]|jgi:carbonic anhydrase/acetyltransferase-like protein (isoleucine patch superfamily)